ncbi:MAG: peptidase M14 [Deltaproteobacteria bacterium]|nr:peptidase M14 [Deltaproteobacteria bacterium]
MRLAVVAALAVSACHPRVIVRDLTTTAERSGWKVTGRQAEAVRLCHDFAASYPAAARCETFGTSPEGREMVALVLSHHGFDPAEHARAHRPVLLIEAGIHSGEIEGKDAGFWAARDLMTGASPGFLDAATLVFVPIFNVDGHERFGRNNRPNQRGPEEMGFRTTAGALNLNRDWVKADAPEMVAMLGLWRRWNPTLFVDLHTTDGAKFQHDVAVLVAPHTGRGDALEGSGTALEAALLARVTALGHLPLGFYPSFVTDDDPASGFADGEAPPRFSQYYAAARNRLGILVETHSWRTYAERVKATRDVLAALFEEAVAHGRAWRDATDAADAADLAIAGKEIALFSDADDTVRTIEFRGYHYERVPSEVSGGTWTKYDEAAPEIWKVPLRDHLVPKLTVKAPGAGYVIPGGYAPLVADRLARHGLRFQPVATDAALDAEVWRIDGAPLGKTFEGRTTVAVTGAWAREKRSAGQGAIFVPIAQPGARLVLHLLEPSAPDSLVAWGFFNGALETKEYMEAYVAEEVARTMLADPAIKAAFDEVLKDPAFAASPARRLEWFYRRSPAWDERVGLIPVFRVDVAPPR